MAKATSIQVGARWLMSVDLVSKPTFTPPGTLCESFDGDSQAFPLLDPIPMVTGLVQISQKSFLVWLTISGRKYSKRNSNSIRPLCFYICLQFLDRPIGLFWRGSSYIMVIWHNFGCFSVWCNKWGALEVCQLCSWDC